MQQPCYYEVMLRDYYYTENWRLLDGALEKFIDLPPRLSLVGFAALSPDSFLWKIFDGSTVYYVYAEDFVPSLEHVRHSLIEFAKYAAQSGYDFVFLLRSSEKII